jgi:serine/threonine protein kinase
MAPEIIKHQIYDGRKADIFSVGVILFILVQGGFPFLSASTDDDYFNLLCQGKWKEYWQAIDGEDLSDDFKDLI